MLDILLQSKSQEMRYQVVYIPKIEDEVVLSEYESLREAEIHLEQILVTKPEVHKFHYIKEKEC